MPRLKLLPSSGVLLAALQQLLDVFALGANLAVLGCACQSSKSKFRAKLASPKGGSSSGLGWEAPHSGSQAVTCIATPDHEGALVALELPEKLS